MALKDQKLSALIKTLDENGNIDRVLINVIEKDWIEVRIVINGEYFLISSNQFEVK